MPYLQYANVPAMSNITFARTIDSCERRIVLVRTTWYVWTLLEDRTLTYKSSNVMKIFTSRLSVPPRLRPCQTIRMLFSLHANVTLEEVLAICHTLNASVPAMWNITSLCECHIILVRTSFNTPGRYCRNFSSQLYYTSIILYIYIIA